MGWSRGVNNNGREIGYAVSATCDFEGCSTSIDRGVAYCCGGVDGHGNAGMDEEAYCGDYFCDEHLYFLYSGDEDGSIMVCPTCYDKQVCPDCEGNGHDEDGELCETCDSHGNVRHRWNDEAGKMVPV